MQPDLLTQNYISILEKTNQQLGLWSNPYGIIVGVLSFLVAFLAVASAYILYRQSKEHKESFENALKEYQKTLQENLITIGIDAERKIDLFITEKNKEIESLTGETKKQAQKIITDLEKEKNSVGPRVQFSSLIDNGILGGRADFIANPIFLNRCLKCGTYQSFVGLDYCFKCGNKL